MKSNLKKDPGAILTSEYRAKTIALETDAYRDGSESSGTPKIRFHLGISDLVPLSSFILHPSAFILFPLPPLPKPGNIAQE